MRPRLLGAILLAIASTHATGQLTRGWSVTRDYPLLLGTTVGGTAQVNSVSHDSANNVYVWGERDGSAVWSKYDPFGNLIRTRVEYGWNEFGDVALVDAHVNAAGRSAILSGNFVYAFDANGNRLWWRHLPTVFADSRAVSVHVSPAGRVLVGGAIGPDGNSRPAVFAFAPNGAPLFSTSVNIPGQPNRDGEVRALAADAAENVLFGGVNVIGTDVRGEVGRISPNGVLVFNLSYFGGLNGSAVNFVRILEGGNFAYGGTSRTTGPGGEIQSAIVGVLNRTTGAEVRKQLAGNNSSSWTTAIHPGDGATDVLFAGRADGAGFVNRVDGWQASTLNPEDIVRHLGLTPATATGRLVYAQVRRGSGGNIVGGLHRYIPDTGQRLDPIPSPLYADPGGMALDSRGFVHEVYNQVDSNGNTMGRSILRRIVAGSRIAWVQPLEGPAAGRDRAEDVQFDAAGNPLILAATEGFGQERSARVLKLDRAGRQLWVSRIDTDGFQPARLVPTDRNDFVVIGNESTGGALRAARINGATGAVEWNRAFRTSFLDQVQIYGIAAERSVGSTIAITATIDINASSRSGWSALLDTTTGTLRFSRVFDVDAQLAGWSAVAPMPDGGYVAVGRAIQPGGNLPVAARYGATGSLMWVRGYTPAVAPSGTWLSAAVGPDGHLYFGGGAGTNNPRPALVASYTAAGTLRWVRPLQVTGAILESKELGFAGAHVVASFGSFRSAGFARLDRATGAVAAVRQIPATGLISLDAMHVSADGTVLLGAYYQVPDAALPRGRKTGQLRFTRWNNLNVAGPTLTVPAGVLGTANELLRIRRNAFGEWIAVGGTVQPNRANDVMALQLR